MHMRSPFRIFSTSAQFRWTSAPTSKSTMRAEIPNRPKTELREAHVAENKIPAAQKRKSTSTRPPRPCRGIIGGEEEEEEAVPIEERLVSGHLTPTRAPRATFKPLKTPKGTARHGITRPLPTRLNLRRPGPMQEQSPKVGVLIVQKLVTFWMLVGLSSRKVLMKERA